METKQQRIKHCHIKRQKGGTEQRERRRETYAHVAGSRKREVVCRYSEKPRSLHTRD